MSIRREDTVSDIVASDFRVAAVLHRYGIPFCCGGDRTVAEACRERGLDERDVLGDLRRVCARRDRDVPRVTSWQPETLVAYIVGTHHAYLRMVMPAIAAHTRKAAVTHGRAYPELREVAEIFEGLVLELTSHMAKEESILFPYIVAIAEPDGAGAEFPDPPFGRIDSPLRVVEAEHAAATGAVARIRRLTGAYTPPPDACTTLRICYAELEAFERDLRIHLYLEDSVLFPQARALAGRRE